MKKGFYRKALINAITRQSEEFFQKNSMLLNGGKNGETKFTSRKDNMVDIYHFYRRVIRKSIPILKSSHVRHGRVLLADTLRQTISAKSHFAPPDMDNKCRKNQF